MVLGGKIQRSGSSLLDSFTTAERGAWGEAFRHVNEHKQSSLNVLEIATVGRGGRVKGANNKVEKKDARKEASRHAYEYE